MDGWQDHLWQVWLGVAFMLGVAEMFSLDLILIMLAFPGGATRVHKVKIAEFARAQGLPSMFGSREHCEVGGLASYGAHQRTIYVRLAAYADRLLRGEKPGDLPIEQSRHDVSSIPLFGSIIVPGAAGAQVT